MHPRSKTVALYGGNFQSENLNLESFKECLKKIDGWFDEKCFSDPL